MTIKRDLLLKRVIDAKHNDFVKIVNLADERIYIQSAFSIPDAEKRRQETHSLTHIGDSFRKVVIVGDTRESPWRNENGIIFMSLAQFLLDPHSIEPLEPLGPAAY